MGGKAGPTAVGGAGGALSGAAAGATVGSVVPVVGTAIGAGVGALVGGLGGGFLGSKSGQSVTPTPPPQLPDDPNYTAQLKKASDDQIAALTNQARGDTAAIMARYGARLALAGTQGTQAAAVA